MVLLPAEVTMAAAYSMDLRKRVMKAWDASGDADEIAATFAVSRAWVHRLAQRQRETGSIALRPQMKFRSRVLAGQEERLKALVNARPDATPGGAPGRAADDGRAQHALAGNRSLGIDLQKKRYTPTNSVDLMSPPLGASGSKRCRSTMRRSTCSLTNRASRRICY